MLDGKMLRGLTGTPMRRIALANSSLAEADPEPLTLANLTTKSLVDARGAWVGVMRIPPRSSLHLKRRFQRLFPCRRASPGSDCANDAAPGRGIPASAGMTGKGKASSRCLPRMLLAASGSRVRLQQQELLHVPGTGRAALGAQAAVQADVFVLDHHPQRLQWLGHVQVLLGVERRRGQARAEFVFFAVGGKGDAVGRADVDAGI